MIDNAITTRAEPSAQILVYGLFLGSDKYTSEGNTNAPIGPASFKRPGPLAGSGSSADRPARGLFGRFRQSS